MITPDSVIALPMFRINSRARRFTYCNCSERERTRIPGLDCPETIFSQWPGYTNAVLTSAITFMTPSSRELYGMSRTHTLYRNTLCGIRFLGQVP
jgi:hypothetical protein